MEHKNGIVAVLEVFVYPLLRPARSAGGVFPTNREKRGATILRINLCKLNQLIAKAFSLLFKPSGRGYKYAVLENWSDHGISPKDIYKSIAQVSTAD
jgi:hypothetical protein